jgi:hypothetical protein
LLLLISPLLHSWLAPLCTAAVGLQDNQPRWTYAKTYEGTSARLEAPT